MRSIEQYVAAVDRRIPRWYPGRPEILADLRSHLADRVDGGESEEAVVAGMESPDLYAGALTEAIPLAPAPLGRRVAAYLLDVTLGILFIPLVAWTVSLLLGYQGGFWPAQVWRTWIGWPSEVTIFSLFLLAVIILALVGISSLILSIVYFPIAEAIWGTTVGKHLLGLSVVTVDGKRIGWGHALLRRIPFYFEFFWLDALFALFSKNRQRAFDRVAKTLVVQVGPERRGHLAKAAPALIALLVFALPAAGQPSSAPIPPAPGRLVEIGGGRLHLNCTGAGSPTVVFASGASSFALDWALVQPEVARSTRVCSYDRAGYAWSDPANAPEIPQRAVSELHALLQAAGEPSPYLLVGASRSGLYVRLFALRYPSEVAGMVLVDPAHEDRLFTMLNGEAVTISTLTAEQMASTIARRSVTVPPDWRPVQIGEPFDRLPADLYSLRQIFDARLIASIVGQVPYETILETATGDHAALAQLHDLSASTQVPLGDLPLIVLTRGTGDSGLQQAHASLARLSRNSSHRIVTGSGHEIHLYAPSEVVMAIADVRESIRSGGRVPTR